MVQPDEPLPIAPEPMSTTPDAVADPLRSAECKTIGDFYTPAGRAAIGRVAGSYLQSARITTIELLHSARHQRAFGDAGTNLAQAVQKTAVAQVKGKSVSVNERVRQLYELTDRLRSETTRRLEQQPPVPVTPDEAPRLATRQEGETDEVYAFRRFAELTAALESCTSWSAKLERLLDVADALDENLEPLDALISDLLRVPLARREVLGVLEPTADELRRLLYLHAPHASDPAPPAPSDDAPLARRFQELAEHTDLPETREVLLGHLVNLLRASERLCRGTVSEELDELMAVSALLRVDHGFLGGTATVDALEQRFGRVLSDETIYDVMLDCPTPAEKILRAIELHGQVVGEKPKTYLADLCLSLIAEPQAERRFAEGDQSPISVMRRMGRVHRAVLRSTIAERKRDRLAEQIEEWQTQLIVRHRILDSIAQGNKPTATKALALLELITSHAFTPGDNVKAARRQVYELMRQPDFALSLIANCKTPEDRATRIKALEEKLAKAGMAAPA